MVQSLLSYQKANSNKFTMHEFHPRIISTFVHDEHTLFNLIKCFSTDENLKPAYFKPKYEGYIEKSYLHNGEKHVNGEWLFKYLCSSKFSLRKQFIEWVCKQLAKEANNITMDINSINAPVPSNSINIKGVHMCCANCKSDVISPISGKITKKPIQQMKSKKSKDKLLKRIINVFCLRIMVKIWRI
jgi:hypothetical protein